MKNIFGKREDLTLYYKNGELAYRFIVVSDDYSWEATFDECGNQTSYKDSDDFSWVATYDDQNRITSYKDSDGDSWKRIYNENGYEQINL